MPASTKVLRKSSSTKVLRKPSSKKQVKRKSSTKKKVTRKASSKKHITKKTSVKKPVTRTTSVKKQVPKKTLQSIEVQFPNFLSSILFDWGFSLPFYGGDIITKRTQSLEVSMCSKCNIVIYYNMAEIEMGDGPITAKCEHGSVKTFKILNAKKIEPRQSGALVTLDSGITEEISYRFIANPDGANIFKYSSSESIVNRPTNPAIKGPESRPALK